MDWLNAAVQGLLLGGLYALFAVGLSLVFGTMRLTNIAHGDLTLLPAYFALLLVNALRFNPFYSIPITMVMIPILMAFGAQGGEIGPLWWALAIGAGFGGNLTPIGSAAGVAAMGLEKIHFFWYVRKISGLALIGYLAGAGTYLLQYQLLH